MNKNKKRKETLNECRKNKNFMIGFVILVTVVLVAIFADVIAPYHYTEQNTGGRFEVLQHGPSVRHRRPGPDLFFQDNLRYQACPVGSRTSSSHTEITIGVEGSCLRLFSGNGSTGYQLSRTGSDLVYSGDHTCSLVVTMMGKSLTNTIIATSLVAWASYARTVRAKTMSLRNMAFS